MPCSPFLTPLPKLRASYVAPMELPFSCYEMKSFSSLQSLVPLLRDDLMLGVIVLRQSHLRPFTPPQIQAIEVFADQAVIAISNVGLFEQVQQRTLDLTEALQQQTATAEVLKVISSSPGELEPVFQALLENAVHLCEAEFGMLFLAEGDGFRFGALYGTPAAYAEAWMREPLIHPGPSTGLVRAKHTRSVVHIA